MSESGNKSASLSVVVVSFNTAILLERCLSSISPQCEGVEVLVVRDSKREVPEQLRQLYRHFKWIDCPAGATVPQMRQFGIEGSAGDIVALVEDDCLLAPSWTENLRAAHDSDFQAIGGAVIPGEFQKGLDWGIFFCEYARFMPPFAGDVEALPGNNLSYKRQTLKLLAEQGALTDGFREVVVNSVLLQSGKNLHADAKLSVTNINCWKLTNATTVPFHHGRGFAGMRFAKQSAWLRLPYLAIALLLPALQTLRVCHRVASRQPYRARLIQALPAIVLFWTSWSVGEFMGYLLGPGRSLEQWR